MMRTLAGADGDVRGLYIAPNRFRTKSLTVACLSIRWRLISLFCLECLVGILLGDHIGESIRMSS